MCVCSRVGNTSLHQRTPHKSGQSSMKQQKENPLSRLARGNEMSGPRKLTALMLIIGFVSVVFMFLNQNSSGIGKPPQTEKVDMHTHSTESDGDLTAEQLIDQAQALTMETIWLTDHDMIRDLARTKELIAYGKAHGIHVSFGVEITVDFAGKEHHLLGYFPDSEWKTNSLSENMKRLQSLVAAVKSSRENRNKNMVAWLNKILGSSANKGIFFKEPNFAASFVPLNVATVSAWASEHASLTDASSLGRPHFGKYLDKVTGVIPEFIFGPRSGDGVALLGEDGTLDWDYKQKPPPYKGIEVEGLIHSKTLEKRDIAFVPMEIGAAIDAIIAAHGKAVIAHMPTLGTKWLKLMNDNVPSLAKRGLWGIEALSSEITEESHAKLDEIIRANGLHETGGSDNHGTLKAYAKLGKLYPVRDGIEVKYHGVTEWAHDSQQVSKELSSGSGHRHV